MRRGGHELRGVRPGEAADIAGILDHRALHAEADPEVRDAVLARVAHRLDLALDAAVPEPARHQDAVHVAEVRAGAVALDVLGVHPGHVHAGVVGDAAVSQRLDEALVRVLQLDVLADHRDARRRARRLHPPHDVLPPREVDRPRLQAQQLEHDLVEALAVEHQRHLVHGLDVLGGDDRLLLDVAEQRDLGLDPRRQVAVGAAQQDVGLDADRPQLLDRVLGGLGLELGGRLHEGHQGEVDVQHVVFAEVLLELADRLQERQALDVADGAADLDDDDVGVVGDVGDDLHGPAQVISPALLLDDREIHLAGGDVVVARHPGRGESFVVPEVEVRLTAVVGDEDLTVLVRTHRSRVDVDVRVHLLQGHAVAARLEQRAERGRRQALAQRGDDAAGHEDEFRAQVIPPFPRAGAIL